MSASLYYFAYFIITLKLFMFEKKVSMFGTYLVDFLLFRVCLKKKIKILKTVRSNFLYFTFFTTSVVFSLLTTLDDSFLKLFFVVSFFKFNSQIKDYSKFDKFVIISFAVFVIFNDVAIFKNTVNYLKSNKLDLFESKLSSYDFARSLCFFCFFIFILKSVINTGKRVLFRSFDLDENTKLTYFKIYSYFIYFFGFLYFFTFIGFSMKNVTLILSSLGVGVGFGMQKIVSNFISGLIVMSEKKFKINDIILLTDGTWCRIKNIGIRSTTVSLFTGETMVIPNDNIAIDMIKNISISDEMRCLVDFTVDYSCDIRHVQDVAIESCNAVDRVMKKKDFEACCVASSSCQNGVNMILYFWINKIDKGVSGVKSDVIISLLENFKRESIFISIPKIKVVN